MTYAVRESKRKNFNDIIKFAVYSVIAIVVGLVGVGIQQWYQDEYKPMHETVVDVNGTKFDMTYYIDMLKYVSGSYSQYAEYFTAYALQYIEYYELIKQGAEELGITVSEKEISATIKEKEYANTPAARDMVRASLLVPKLEEHFGAQIEKSGEHNYVWAMFLESQSQVDAVKNRIASGELFKDIAIELSLDSVTKEAGGDLGWLPAGVIDDILSNTVLSDELISNAIIGELHSVIDETKTKKVGYWILKVTESETVTDGEGNVTTNASVKAILTGSLAEAEEVMALLEAGGDFDTLAKQYSQKWSEETGSVLNVTTGDYSDVFQAYALNPEVEINALSEIIKDTDINTKGGYWLYQVAATEIQEISEDNMDKLIEDALDAWIAEFDYDTVVVSENIEDMKKFAAAKVKGS
jgi:peptidyl-prolyl cis-trans isomerase SurA